MTETASSDHVSPGGAEGPRDAALGAAERRGAPATTSEKQFRLYEPGLRKRLARDWFVARYIWRIFWLWMTVGGKLRRAKRDAAKEGRVLYIDKVMGGGDL